MRLGDRIAVMRAGKLVQTGHAEELYRSPAALFVARLFSEINEVEVRVAGGRIVTPIGSLPAPGIADGALATLCIRERGIGLMRGNGQTDGADLKGRVRSAKFLGDAVRYEVVAEGFEAPLNVRTVAGEALSKGSEVRLRIDPGEALVFPTNGDKSP